MIKHPYFETAEYLGDYFTFPVRAQHKIKMNFYTFRISIKVQMLLEIIADLPIHYFILFTETRHNLEQSIESNNSLFFFTLTD